MAEPLIARFQSVSRKSTFLSSSPRTSNILFENAIVFFAYVVAGKLGQATSHLRSSNLGPVWPAYGIALAVIILWGKKIVPALWSAAFLVALSSPIQSATAALQACSATLAAGSGVFLLQKVFGFDSSLRRLRDVVSLILVGAFGSAIVSATIGILALRLAHVTPYLGISAAWLIYWFGDSTGVLIVTPLVLTLPRLLHKECKNLVEAASLLLLLCTFTCVVFDAHFLAGLDLEFLAFALFPFVMWPAIRFGIPFTSICILTIATVAVLATAVGSGPFARNDAFTNALLLDIFFTIIAVSGLTLAAANAEKTDAQESRELMARKQASAESGLSLSRQLIEGQEKERTRIARELHDDIGQRLAMLAVSIRMLQSEPSTGSPSANELFQEASQLSEDVHTLSHNLHSSTLEHVGLIAAARGFCREFSIKHKLSVDFRHDEIPASVTGDMALTLFRILQEALHNALKYSGVDHVTVSVGRTASDIFITVRDEGVGFDPSDRKHTGLGLLSMDERVRLAGGTLRIESSPGLGTLVEAHIPRQNDDGPK